MGQKAEWVHDAGRTQGNVMRMEYDEKVMKAGSAIDAV
jgi:hypothetical protein